MRVPEPADPDAVQPLRALWRRYGAYRARFVGAVAASTVNKVGDVVPELLIGAAVDVVVRGDESFVGELLGVESRYAQLGWLAVINVVVWIVESVTEYVAERPVARPGPGRRARPAGGGLRPRAAPRARAGTRAAPAGSTLAILNDDVNQLERFLDVGAPAILQTALNVRARRRGLRGRVAASSLLLAFLPIPVIVVGSLRFQRRLEPRYDGVRDAVGRPVRHALATTSPASPPSRRSPPRTASATGSAAVSQAYREANSDAIRSSAAFVPLIRMAILAGFTCTLLLGGWATLAATSRSASTPCWSS